MNPFEQIFHQIDAPDQNGLSQLAPSLFDQLVDNNIPISSLESSPTVGTPADDTKDWVHQTTDFTCAVVSQEMILHEFGIDVSEATLVHEADSHGLLSDHGTNPEDLGKLLDIHGISNHMNPHGSVADLTNELAQGHKVIVGIFADELWQQDPVQTGIREFLGLDGANHAIVLTGLDMSDPSHPQVIVNDPGDPHGAGKAYPLNQFLEAWHGSQNMYVATDSAPPHLGINALFGANYHPELGTYMDTKFWTSFLQPFIGPAANYWIHHRNEIWPGGQTANNIGLSGGHTAEEKGLF
jgi:hypothetical protein